MQSTLKNTVQIDVSQYTIAGIHFDPIKRQLISVSPGLVGEYSPWYLVSVDPTTGKVTELVIIADAGKFVPFYGGNITILIRDTSPFFR
jgi:hypothetical protein